MITVSQRRSLGASLAFFLAALGCAAAQQSPVTAPAVIGTDLNGDQCRWEQRTDVPAERGAPPAANIFCGGAKRPAGTVTPTVMPIGLPPDPVARHKAIEDAAADTAVARDDAMHMRCSAGKWQTGPAGTEIFLQPCALTDSEWPQIVVVASFGPLLLRGAGLPAALPAIEQGMARLAGQPQIANSFADPKVARQMVVALSGARSLTATPSDYDQYLQLTETARVEASRGNYGEAEGHYRSALQIITNVFGDQSPSAGALLMELALQVSNQERFDEAGALFRQADPIIQSTGGADDRARLLLYEAFDAANRGRFDEALEFAGNSANTWRGVINQGGGFEAGINSDTTNATERGELAFSLDLEAEMALRTNNLPEADAAVSEASEILTEEQGLPPWWRAEALTTMGEIRAAEGRMDEADAAFRAALVLQERVFGDTAPTAVTYLTFGRIYAGQQMWPEAVRAFRLALDILQKDQVARSQVIADEITPFVVAANAYAQAVPSERATLDPQIFAATQLIGKSLVDDTVNRVAARLAESAPAIAKLVDQLEQTTRARDAARLELAQAVSLPDDQRGSVRENQLMAEINSSSAAADALEKRIEAQYPDYAKYADPGPVPLADMQRALAPDEGLLLIESGRARSFVVLVRKDRLVARPIALSEADLGDAVNDLRKAFVVHDGQVDAFDTARAYGLYHSIFGNIESGLTGVDHLIVVPTGPLASLPLSLLVTAPPKPGAERDYAAAQFLLKRMAISEAPSARAFYSLREQAPSTAATQPLFAVANPDFSGGGAKAGNPQAGLEALQNSCRDQGPVPAALIRALPPLPDTVAEVRKVAAILQAGPGSILMGDDATEPRVLAAPLQQYRVLYFATHGLLPTALRCQSEPALVLSPPAIPATSHADDGVLDASEVAELHLNADLVVLSACNTATAGGEFGGESLSGLAGAFFHAGARSVLASHWEVPSAQTVDLMTGLFQRLGPDLNGGIAEALRQSQLALASKPATAHPFFWAAFTLIGDGGARSARRNAALDGGAITATADAAAPTTPARRQ